jgi:hypothetical protein
MNDTQQDEWIRQLERERFDITYRKIEQAQRKRAEDKKEEAK